MEKVLASCVRALTQFAKIFGENVNIIQFDKQHFNKGQLQMLGSTEKTLPFVLNLKLAKVRFFAVEASILDWTT